MMRSTSICLNIQHERGNRQTEGHLHFEPASRHRRATKTPSFEEVVLQGIAPDRAQRLDRAKLVPQKPLRGRPDRHARPETNPVVPEDGAAEKTRGQRPGHDRAFSATSRQDGCRHPARK